ncbi:hypothetical protein GCM10022243_01870 [Saccharothrix violaceirubra]|uniref:DUF4352 domain-containing protein n=1 Tax=Saccharothrix violaceirubra TaxID=413306 RepID=A0A7W7WW20_9PSEU|nr:hypothetical protein [Saccharothrix violaceirubra]MBB4965944.1 hypothetical protein [Saccharothrix violaceirubra]
MHPLRNSLAIATCLLTAVALTACGTTDTPKTTGGPSTTSPASATVLAQGEIPGSAAASATAAPVTGTSVAATPTGRLKYGESMGYALPETKDWDTALEVRVTDLAATRGEPAGTFEIGIANRTGSPFDLAGLQVRAVSDGKTVAELKRDPGNEALFKTLASPAVVTGSITLPVEAGKVEIWVQPSPTATEITSWSTNGS